MTIRLLLADDQALVRGALAALLNLESDLEIVAEVGRQPWVIYGVLRTADAVSPIGASEVTASLLAFIAIYAVVFTTGAIYILRLIDRGPAEISAVSGDRAPSTPMGVALNGEDRS